MNLKQGITNKIPMLDENNLVLGPISQNILDICGCILYKTQQKYCGMVNPKHNIIFNNSYCIHCPQLKV